MTPTPTPPTAASGSADSLLQRIEDSMSRIGAMASDHRGPRMSIPVNPIRDDDVFICDTLRMLREFVTAHSPPVLSARPNEAELHALLSDIHSWMGRDYAEADPAAAGSFVTENIRPLFNRVCRALAGSFLQRAFPKNEADAPRGQAVGYITQHFRGQDYIFKVYEDQRVSEFDQLYAAPPPSPVGEYAPASSSAMQADGVREKYREPDLREGRLVGGRLLKIHGVNIVDEDALAILQSIGAVVPQEGKSASQRMADAGFKRRPSHRALPSDEGA